MLITPRMWPDAEEISSQENRGRLISATYSGGFLQTDDLVGRLRVDELDEDRVTSMARAAQQVVEHKTGIALDKQTATWIWENPETWVEAPRGPIRSITSATQTVEGTDTALTASNYYATPGFRKVRVFQKGESLVLDQISVSTPVFFTIVCTIGLTEGTVRDKLIELVYQTTADLYNQIGTMTAGESFLTQITSHVDALLEEHRVWWA